ALRSRSGRGAGRDRDRALTRTRARARRPRSLSESRARFLRGCPLREDLFHRIDAPEIGARIVIAAALPLAEVQALAPLGGSRARAAQMHDRGQMPLLP